jgi:hypothetical protein
MLTYRIVTQPSPDSPDWAEAPVAGIAVGGGAVFSLAETDFPRIPELRAWLGVRGISILSEAGSVGPTVEVEDDRLYRLTSPASVSALVTGIARSLDPCPACGLGTEQVEAIAAARVAHARPPEPLVTVLGACWVMSGDLVGRLEGAGLSDGLRRTTVAFDGGVSWAVWPERAISGVAYPFGPEPCGACGRASGLVNGRREFLPPRYGLGLSLPEPDGPPGWWWHNVYGQTLPLADAAVVRALREAVPDIGVFPVPDAGTPGAFLPEELR